MSEVERECRLAWLIAARVYFTQKNHETLSREFMARYPKIREALAKS